MAVAVSYPQRPGETECQYYMKTGTCKYAQKCKFHHPPDITPSFCPLAPATDVTIGLNKEAYPRRPGEQSCTFFLKTGTCKYKMSCKFDHPPEAIQQTLQLQNTPYPRRPGEQHCSYYLKTGKCKFGATCRYDHPDLRPEHGGMVGPGYHQNGPMGPEPRVVGVPPPMATPYYGHPDSLLTIMPPQQHPMAYNPTQLPQRPGEKECTFFLKTARCQYGSRCKFHHPAEKLAGNLAPLGVMGMPTMGPAPYPMGPAGVPMDPYMAAYCPPVPPMAPPPMPRSNSQGGPMPMDMQNTPAAMLPERPGHEACGYYLRTGQCAFGMNCRFDHPRQGNGMAGEKRASPAAANKDSSNMSESEKVSSENGDKGDQVQDQSNTNGAADVAAAGVAAGQSPHAYQNGGYQYATAAAAGVVYGDNGTMVYQKGPAEYGGAYAYPYTAAGYVNYRAQA